MSENEEVREQLAALAHAQWSGWHRSLQQFVVVDDEGRWILDRDKGARWQRQMQTPYADLPEQEKTADRAEADRVLEVLVAVLAAEYSAVCARRGAWRRTPLDLTHVAVYEAGARAVLLRLAARLGVDDLHERARGLRNDDDERCENRRQRGD